MQVAWPRAREGTHRSCEDRGIPLGECISKVDQSSPASPDWGTNQVPRYQQQVRLSSLAVAGAPVTGEVSWCCEICSPELLQKLFPLPSCYPAAPACAAGIAASHPSTTPGRAAGCSEHPVWPCPFSWVLMACRSGVSVQNAGPTDASSPDQLLS